MFEEIRKIVLNSINSKNYKKSFHVTSNLSWLRYEKQINELENLIPENSKVLDIGCGWGFTTAMIKHIKPKSKVIGVDIKSNLLWKKFTNYNGVEYIICDALDLKFEDATFDFVVSFGVLEHIKDSKKFLKESLRVLKENSKGVIFNLPNKYSMNEFLAKKLGIWSHKIKYDEREIKNLLSSCNIKEFYIKREFLIPAQVNRLNPLLNSMFNKTHEVLYLIDELLCKSFLNFFSQTFTVIYKK
ncbi:MAG: methyltransferase domain-containing protein [Candidatus Aenigmatarchaeota archaeon]|nr:methyltransferase domain-containing protein [Candidatus Aenigmarchaeota archaeon]